MGTIRGLYERFRHLIHEGFKFLVIGAIGTVVTFGVANGLHSIGKYKAITIATVLATVVTYLGNRYWTFKGRQGQGTTRESIIFFILNGIGLLIYYGCIGLTDLAGLGSSKLWYNMALIVGTGLGTLFRFWSYRKWVWLAPSATPVLSADESDQERAQDLAAVVGAAPASHHQNGQRQNGQRPASTEQRPRTPGAHRRSQ
ncbi:MAG TPA: GtrA family protein [Streptosporangiaceae bacterium]|nr:GtrA family protein [Streptosporangiaceae bacterium]